MRMRSTLSILMAMVFTTFLVGACSGGDSSSGNTISGQISMSDGSASVSRMTALSHDTSADETTGEPYVGATVQLLLIAEDGTETLVDETTTDEDGKFEFDNVGEGNYEIVVLDPETGEEVTRAPIPHVEGDDVTVDGAISTDGTDWTIDFDADEDSDEELELQNDAQTKKLQDLAAASGSEESEIFAMRTEEKMGWGLIAKNLGIHPSVLGLGYVDSDDDGEEDGFETEMTTTTSDESIGESSKPGKGKGNGGGGKGKPENPGKGNNGNGKGNSGK